MTLNLIPINKLPKITILGYSKNLLKISHNGIILIISKMLLSRALNRIISNNFSLNINGMVTNGILLRMFLSELLLKAILPSLNMLLIGKLIYGVLRKVDMKLLSMHPLILSNLQDNILL